MAPVQPGTYRIVSVASSTYITLHDHWDAVCWRKLDNKNQQWYIQRSGEGYRIKNCLTGLYLVVSDTALGAKVFCGRYPTTWELNQGIEDHDMYIIKQAGCDRIVGPDWGKTDDGNKLHTWSQEQWVDHKRWRFERLGDDTGEEEQKLFQELQSKSRQISEKDQRIQEQNAQLAEKGNQLAEKDSQLAQMKKRLASQDDELSRVKIDLAHKSALLLQTKDALRQASESLGAQGNESLRNEVQSISYRLEHDQAQQTEKAEKLQERVESLERMFAEMVNQNIMPRNLA